MADYEIKIRLRNNRILRRARERGLNTLRELADAAGLSVTTVCALVTMHDKAKLRNGDWRPHVMTLSSALGCEPEDLFTDRQASGGVKPLTAEATEAQVIQLSDLADNVPSLASPENDVFRAETKNRIATALALLTPREKDIVERRFGLNGREEQRLEQIGDEFGCSQEHIRQIEYKALRKLGDVKTERGKIMRNLVA